MRLEELGPLKYPVTQSGIEHATFRHVEYCLVRTVRVVCFAEVIADTGN
jgi:hypothetical protein